ncbi:MAG: M48 family metallopeptidase [Deltaproteobacteria bacterium]|nr:M48 family metallopeptidase [Deltaproteobacteria bacterium]
MALQAASDAVSALTLDDEDVQRLSVEVAQQSDRKHEVAPPDNSHAKRLARLTDGHRKIDGHELDFKVYLSPTVNAFAIADGTIRIYSGLMDMMTDGELVFVIGHEIGHVVENHVKEKLRLAYAGSAVRKAVASQQNEAGDIARSAIGALTENLLNAQFSQQEEREADDFGVRFLKQKGHDIQPAISALMKLATLGGDHSFLSSHPAPAKRAERLQNNTLTSERVEDPSFLSRVVEWLKRHWPFKNDAGKNHA